MSHSFYFGCVAYKTTLAHDFVVSAFACILHACIMYTKCTFNARHAFLYIHSVDKREDSQYFCWIVCVTNQLRIPR